MLLYNGFVEFEIAPLLILLKGNATLRTFSVDEKVVISHSGLRVEADELLQDIEPSNVDLLVIPGGEPKVYRDRRDIQDFLQMVNKNERTIAAICGGPEFLAQAGLLSGLRIAHGHDPEYATQVFKDSVITEEDVVVEGTIITARGQAYVEFAVEIGRHIGLFENEQEAQETESWFKNE